MVTRKSMWVLLRAPHLRGPDRRTTLSFRKNRNEKTPLRMRSILHPKKVDPLRQNLQQASTSLSLLRTRNLLISARVRSSLATGQILLIETEFSLSLIGLRLVDRSARKPLRCDKYSRVKRETGEAFCAPAIDLKRSIVVLSRSRRVT